MRKFDSIISRFLRGGKKEALSPTQAALSTLIETETRKDSIKFDNEFVIKQEIEQVRELALYVGMHLNVLELSQIETPTGLKKGLKLYNTGSVDASNKLKRRTRFGDQIFVKPWLVIHENGRLDIVVYEGDYIFAMDDQKFIMEEEWETAMEEQRFEYVKTLIQPDKVADTLYSAVTAGRQNIEEKEKQLKERKHKLASRKLLP